jgi:hypothetical protein
MWRIRVYELGFWWISGIDFLFSRERESDKEGTYFAFFFYFLIITPSLHFITFDELVLIGFKIINFNPQFRQLFFYPKLNKLERKMELIKGQSHKQIDKYKDET